MTAPVRLRSDILGNYRIEKHFLQVVHIPAFAPRAKNFLYMKNHKAACTTVLATLLGHLQDQLGTNEHNIDMRLVHWPPKSLILMGPRRLTVTGAIDAINDEKNFRFTIVRDPVARTVSAYADKIHGGQAQKFRLMKYLGRPEDSVLSLSGFLDIMAQDVQARDLDRHWREQRKEISYDYIPFDFIADVKNLDGAMAIIIKNIFGKEMQMRDTRVSFEHRSSSKELIGTMTNADMKNIEMAFEADFAMYEDVKKKFG